MGNNNNSTILRDININNNINNSSNSSSNSSINRYNIGMFVLFVLRQWGQRLNS